MPYRVVISTEFAKLFSVLANPNRVRIVQELHQGELSVNDLQELLGITHAAVSQQLAVLRTNRLVVERRDGRNVFYKLKEPELAAWVLSGIKFISPDHREIQKMMNAIEKAKETWTSDEEDTKSSPRSKPTENGKGRKKK